MIEKEILDKMNKDKDYRTKILIDLNVALQQAQRVTADDYDEWKKFNEYKIAVVSLEIERKKLENQLKQANEVKDEERRRKELIQKKRDKYKAKSNKLQQRIDEVIKYIKESEEEYGYLEDSEKTILEILKGVNNE